MSTDPSNLPPLPKNHLDHPENWTTGSEPVTKNQANFIGVLESKNPRLVPEGGLDTSSLSKSDASDVIDKLKKGEKLDDAVNDPENHVETGGKTAAPVEEKGETSSSSKRKEPASEPTDPKKNTEGTKESQAILDKAVEGSKTKQSADVPASAEEIAQKEDARPSKKARKEDKAKDKNGKDDQEEKESAKEDGTVDDPIEVDTPPTEKIETPAEPEVDQLPAKTSAPTKNGSNGNSKPDTTPGDEAHLDHPENWATGDQPATDKQKGFIKVLEKQKGSVGAAGDVEHLGKSEASEKIEELKQM